VVTGGKLEGKISDPILSRVAYGEEGDIDNYSPILYYANKTSNHRPFPIT